MSIIHLLRSAVSGLFLACVLLTGCSPQPTEQALRERIQAYWDAHKINDVLTVYQMESGSLPGGELRPDAMGRRMVAKVRDFHIKEVKLNGNKAEAVLSVGYLFGDLQRDPIFHDVKEEWEFIDGAWYHTTKNPRGVPFVNPRKAVPDQPGQQPPAPPAPAEGEAQN